jgi:hypothetical protein
MTRRCSRFPLEDSTELREVHSRLHAKWGTVLDDGQTPCCYALSRHHVLLRAIEKLLELLPQRSSAKSCRDQITSRGEPDCANWILDDRTGQAALRNSASGTYTLPMLASLGPANGH